MKYPRKLKYTLPLGDWMYNTTIFFQENKVNIDQLTTENKQAPSAQSGGPFAMKHCYVAIFEK